MKLLITGANGQLGKELNKQLKDKNDYELLLTDVDEMDITSIDSVKSVMTGFMPDVVINCAAHTAVDLCEDDEENAERINTLGPKNLALVSKELGAKIVQVSTDYVFDGDASTPYVESDKTNPQGVYGRTKLNGEIAVAENNDKYYIVRTAWLYGDGKNFVRTMIALSKKMDKLKVVNDQLGSPTSTAELARAIIKLINTEYYGIYHATCEGQCTWYDFALKIFEYSDIEIQVDPCTSDEFVQKAKRPTYSVLENKALFDKLGYKLSDWQVALKEYILGEQK